MSAKSEALSRIMIRNLALASFKFSLPMISFVLLAALAMEVEAQQTSARLSTLRVIEYAGDLRSLLASLSTSYDVVIGFEVARIEPQSYVKVSLKEATIEDIMNAIALSRPIYRWQKTSVGFEVLPLDQPDKFLDTVVSSFHVENVSTYDALKALIGLEEVKNALGVSGMRNSETIAPHDDQARMNIDVRAATIREVLNRITSNSGAKFWTYQRDTAGPASLTIKIIGNSDSGGED